MRTDPHPRSGRPRRSPLGVLVTSATALLLTLTAAALGGGAAVAPAAAYAAPGPTLTVDTSAERHAISPDIYGMSFADPALATELRLPVNRWGGNYTDRYNWRLDTWNTGRDWFFENVSGCWPDCAGRPPAQPAQQYRRIIDGDRATGAQTLLTLPMVGWVAKTARYAQPLACSYPRSLHPVQDSFDTDWIPDGADACGNGRSGGSWITGNDPNTANEPSTPQLSSDWIADIAARYGAGAVRFYGLGNEPALWDDTHVDVHPQPTTSAELRDRSIALARAVKNADPNGLTLGFSEWGWPHYFKSAAEDRGRADGAKPAGEPLVTWFLDRMREASQGDGKRLLDYLDLHYYQQMTALGAAGTTDVTRSLWDPAYTDESWIGQRIRLLPRMREWIAGHYPGTKVALSEYDLSVGGSDPTTEQQVVDTLIQADTLGILARERVDLAARWSPPTAGEIGANAFRAFRNFDGAGGRFGDRWLDAASSDEAAVSVFGSRHADGGVTVVIVNKRAAPLSSPLVLAAARPAQRWQWSGAAPQARPQRVADVALASDAGGGGTTTLELPARSLTVLHVPGERAVDPPPPDGDPQEPPAEQPVGQPPAQPGQPAPTPQRPQPSPQPQPGAARPGGVPGGAGAQRAAEQLATALGLPANRSCVRRATLSFRLRSPERGKRLAGAAVGLRGRRARRLGDAALRRTVTIGNLPRRGAFTLQVRFRISGERRTSVAHRRYQRCR